MRKIFLKAVLGSTASLTIALVLVASLEAQQSPPPITVEARGGYSFPTGDMHRHGARSDFGYGAALTLGLSPAFGLYGGWGKDRFHCDDCNGESEIEASAFSIGAKAIAPDRTRAHPWVKGGVLVARSLLRTGTSSFESDRHLGFEAAVGLDAPVSEMVSISPSVRFHSFRSEFDGLDGGFGTFEPEMDFRYLSFDLAVLIHLR